MLKIWWCHFWFQAAASLKDIVPIIVKNDVTGDATLPVMDTGVVKGNASIVFKQIFMQEYKIYFRHSNIYIISSRR